MLLPLPLMGQETLCDSLHQAIEAQDIQKVEKLLKLGADPDCYRIKYSVEYHRAGFLKKRRAVMDNHHTPIYTATMARSLPIIKVLEAKGANLQQWQYCTQDTIGGTSMPAQWQAIDVTKEGSSIEAYFKQQGVLSYQERDSVVEKLKDLCWQARKYTDSLQTLRHLVEAIDQSKININLDLMYSSFSKNLPFLYQYLIEHQDYPIAEQHTSRWREGLFKQRNRSYTASVWKSILYTNYPIIEQVEYYQKYQGLSQEQLVALSESYGDEYKYRKKYYTYYLALQNTALSEFKKKKYKKKMDKMREKLRVLYSIEEAVPSR
ncbi:MAG: hypothetical protein AAF734_01225 [Bacteroidota bacterium]